MRIVQPAESSSGGVGYTMSHWPGKALNVKADGRWGDYAHVGHKRVSGDTRRGGNNSGMGWGSRRGVRSDAPPAPGSGPAEPVDGASPSEALSGDELTMPASMPPTPQASVTDRVTNAIARFQEMHEEQPNMVYAGAAVVGVIVLYLMMKPKRP